MKLVLSTFAAVLVLALALGFYIGIDAKQFGPLQSIWLAGSLAMAVIVAFANWFVARLENAYERILQKQHPDKTARHPA